MSAWGPGIRRKIPESTWLYDQQALMVGVLQDWGKERLHYRGEHTTLDLSAQVVTPLEPEPDLSAGLGGSLIAKTT